MRNSWLDRLVGGCLSLLVGSAAVYVAIHLIEAVLTELLIVVGIVVLVTASVVIVRARNRGW